MRRTRIEKEVEICATNLTNKTKFMSTNTKNGEKLTKPISQSSLDIFSIWIPLISKEVSNSQIRFVDVTDSFIRFQSRVFRFYSTNDTSGRYYKSSQFFPQLFALVLMHLVLLVRFLAQISNSFFILVVRMCVLYHNFYCIFPCYLPPN
jgi:hypothetical protein